MTGISENFSFALLFLSPNKERFLSALSLLLSKTVPTLRCIGFTQLGLSQL